MAQITCSKPILDRGNPANGLLRYRPSQAYTARTESGLEAVPCEFRDVAIVDGAIAAFELPPTPEGVVIEYQILIANPFAMWRPTGAFAVPDAEEIDILSPEQDEAIAVSDVAAKIASITGRGA